LYLIFGSFAAGLFYYATYTSDLLQPVT